MGIGIRLTESDMKNFFLEDQIKIWDYLRGPGDPAEVPRRKKKLRFLAAVRWVFTVSKDYINFQFRSGAQLFYFFETFFWTRAKLTKISKFLRNFYTILFGLTSSFFWYIVCRKFPLTGNNLAHPNFTIIMLDIKWFFSWCFRHNHIWASVPAALEHWNAC